ncbi:MAG: hypothetical protein NE328_15050 [Lentisphaeraceae bacterium]|nr:hypothetical protein [Lentisphaeraceae bacterium]
MSTLILGRGHVGTAIHKHNPNFLFTRRKKAHTDTIVFDLENKTTWKNLPAVENIIWTFPARPQNLVEEFYETKLSKVKNLIVMASTSCYMNKRQKEVIDEKSALNTSIIRVKGEEFLRSKGATIMCLAGIYDSERNPLNWLNKGLIRNPSKIVNLIHTEDIVAIVEHFLKMPKPGERYNICDGFPRSWQEIGDRIGFEFRMDPEREVSKLLKNDKIKKILHPKFKFRPLYDLWE